MSGSCMGEKFIECVDKVDGRVLVEIDESNRQGRE